MYALWNARGFETYHQVRLHEKPAAHKRHASKHKRQQPGTLRAPLFIIDAYLSRKKSTREPSLTCRITL
jgi:hypothetical protein